MTNSGDLDGEFTYLYNGNQIIEVRNGADDVELLVVHAEADQGGRAKGYIDEIVCQRVKDRGWAYVHQAEGDQGGSVKDWNVTALAALTGVGIGRCRCTHSDGQDHTWRCWPKAGTARPTRWRCQGAFFSGLQGWGLYFPQGWRPGL